MNKGKKVAKDLVFSISAVALMNVVIQFLIYPVINYVAGADYFGDMLFWIGIVSMLAPSFGIAINNTRLLTKDREKAENGDFLFILSIFSVISCIVCVVISLYRRLSFGLVIAFVYIVIITIFRNYSNVEYRLTLNYKRQFIFYSILSLGYLVGLLLFWVTKRWEFVYIIGETAAVLFVVKSGQVYKGLDRCSEKRNWIAKNSFTLSANYLITNAMLNLDRVVLLYFVGNDAVSQYYVLSLMGKIIAIISGPLNGILIGYLTKGNERIHLKTYIKACGLMLGIGVVFLIGCLIATPIYIRLMYPNLYSNVMGLNLIVNLAQIFYFLTGILVVITLTVCASSKILRAQILYSVIYCGLAFVFTNANGIEGFSYAALISNALYFVMVAFTGVFVLKKKTE